MVLTEKYLYYIITIVLYPSTTKLLVKKPKFYSETSVWVTKQIGNLGVNLKFDYFVFPWHSFKSWFRTYLFDNTYTDPSPLISDQL